MGFTVVGVVVKFLIGWLVIKVVFEVLIVDFTVGISLGIVEEEVEFMISVNETACFVVAVVVIIEIVYAVVKIGFKVVSALVVEVWKGSVVVKVGLEDDFTVVETDSEVVVVEDVIWVSEMVLT